MGATVYNHETKKWEDLDDTAIDAAVQSGKYTFQANEQVPAVSEDGRLVTIPAENLHKAFKDGYRWQTQADRDLDFTRKSDANRKEKFGDQPLTAFAAGLARTATAGLSDVALEAGGLGEATGAVKELNPLMSVTGSVAGLAVPLPGPRGLGGLTSAGKIGTKISERAGGLIKGVEEGVQLTRAQKALRGVATTGLGSAAEGAYYGLGEGISEAALGKPDDIVDNLAAGVGFGALTGGIFGVGFGAAKEAKPFLQSAFDKSASVADNLIQEGARKSTKVIGKAALSVMENEELGKKFGELAQDPTFRALYQKEGLPAANKYAKEVTAAKHQLKSEGKAILKDVKDAVAKEESATAQRIVDEMSASNGDLTHARQRLYATFTDIGEAFDDVRPTMIGPAQRANVWVPKMEALAAQMKASGNPKLMEKSEELLTKMGSRGGLGMNQGDELDALRQIRWAFDRKKIKGLTGRDYKLAKTVWSDARKELNTYPDAELAKSFKAYDSSYSAYLTLEEVANKYKGSTFTNPEAFIKLAPILQRVEALAPDIARIRASVVDTVKYAEAKTNLLAKVKELTGTPLNDPVAVDALMDVVAQFSAKDMRGARLSEISKLLSDLPNLSPMEQAFRVQKALGKDTSKLEKFLPYQKQVAAMEQLGEVGKEKGSAIRGALGSVLGGSLGGVPGAIAGASIGTAMNPRRALDVLTAVERASNVGANKLAQAFRGVTNAITGEKARQVGVAIKVKSEPMAEKRQRFQHIMNAVSRSKSPAGAMKAMTTMTGNAPGMGNIKAALSNRLQTASLYLESKAPKDPMAARSILPQDSDWTPSDTDLAVFMRRVNVINDPTVALDNIKQGTITLEEIDALRTVHPEIYTALQRNVADAIITKGKQIPYKTRVLLGTILGIPTDYSMTPEFVEKMQSAYAQTDQGGRPEGSTDEQPRKKNIDVSPFDSVATETSKITYGDMA